MSLRNQYATDERCCILYRAKTLYCGHTKHMFNNAHKPEKGWKEKGKETNSIFINYRTRFQHKEPKTFFYQIHK